MTVGASAITIYHRRSDPERFGRWVTECIAAARQAPGYVRARQSVPGDGPLDWAVEMCFASAESLHAWLDSPERQTLLRDGEALGFWRSASDLVLVENEFPPVDTGIFLHSVAPGKDAEFIAAQDKLTRITSKFPGHEGTALFSADPDGQWMTVLRFRTAGQLAGWIRSPEREQALPHLRHELTHDFAELPRSAPFGSTVRIADGHTKITPAWKSAMLVLLCLYPTVLLLAKWLTPAFNSLGIRHAPAAFIGNVVSVVLMQWVLMPTVTRPFRRWLDPIDGASGGISLAGAAVVVACYGALIGLFTLVG